jgi:peptide/nickel transport system ATP-binding protein
VCDRMLVMYAGEIVEEGPTHRVLEDPAHPYTRGLLDALPGAGTHEGRLRPIGGAVPEPSAWPPGCRFAPRCAQVWHRCHQEHPASLPVSGSESPGGERAARCWLVEEPRRREDPA